MDTIEVSDIEPGTRFDKLVVHESGEVLFQNDTEITVYDLGALQKSGIREVYLFEDSNELQTFRRSVRVKPFPVQKLVTGKRFELPVLGPDYQLLLKSGIEVDKEFKSSLIRRGIKQIYLRKSDRALKMDQVEEFNHYTNNIDSDEELRKEVLKAVDKESLYQSKEFDRRKHERYALGLEFNYFLVDEQTSTIHEGANRARLQNISQSGLGMLTSKELDENQKFYVDITLSQSGQIKGILRVVWINRQKPHIYEVGAEFVSVDRDVSL